MNRSLRIRTHREACIVLNALREHRDNFYQAPLDTPDKRESWSDVNRLLAEARLIYDAFVGEAWRESQPDDDR